MPQPFLNQAENSYNRGLFLETTRWLAQFMFRRQQETLQNAIPDWLTSLLRTWHARRSTVITLNYDTLVESAVMSVALNAPSAGRIMPQFTPTRIQYGLPQVIGRRLRIPTKIASRRSRYANCMDR